LKIWNLVFESGNLNQWNDLGREIRKDFVNKTKTKVKRENPIKRGRQG
jgi:hypothetical protein